MTTQKIMSILIKINAIFFIIYYLSIVFIYDSFILAGSTMIDRMVIAAIYLLTSIALNVVTSCALIDL